MPIVPPWRWRDLAFWGVWALVALMLLLLPWRAPPTAPAAGCRPSALGSETAGGPWHSPFDPFPALNRAVRTHWQAAWSRLRHGLNAWRAWGTLLARVWGCRTLAELIAVLTRRQVARYLGALPVLYPLLERLQVRAIVNRYCPTESPVDHGAVVVILVLNRLLAPRPLYRVMDWLAHTVLADAVGVPATRFNDDRLGRTLDALAAHAQALWQAIASQALLRYHIDLSVVFYDLTALAMTGDYPASELVDYGFAHNTPSDCPKVKVGLVASRDGGVPCLFQPWLGRTADRATVEHNMEALRALLNRQGWDTQQVLVVGDRANLNSELALAYADRQLKYLAGVPLLEKAHRALLLTPTERDLSRQPLTADHGPTGYGGWTCDVPFTHAGRTVLHRGLVVLSGPMRTALRRTRAQQFRALWAALRAVQAKIGQTRHRTAADVQRRAETQLRRSPVGALVGVDTALAGDGGVTLRWWVDREALAAAMRADGRYLLATNDPRLPPARMLALYRDKDALEKRFRVFKQDLRVRPLFVHGDERIRAMLLVNLIALLAYSLLERQARHQGLGLTARRILERLSDLHVVEVEAQDGSRLWTVSEFTPAQQTLLRRLGPGLGGRAASPAADPLARLTESRRWPLVARTTGPPGSIAGG